ncbi:hypothetical protein ACVXZY_15825 [Staphylococcus aureus]
MEAHDFIKREYWISNFDKVKKMFPDSSIYVYYAGIYLPDSPATPAIYCRYFYYRQLPNRGIGKFIIKY